MNACGRCENCNGTGRVLNGNDPAAALCACFSCRGTGLENPSPPPSPLDDLFSEFGHLRSAYDFVVSECDAAVKAKEEFRVMAARYHLDATNLHQQRAAAIRERDEAREFLGRDLKEAMARVLTLKIENQAERKRADEAEAQLDAYESEKDQHEHARVAAEHGAAVLREALEYWNRWIVGWNFNGKEAERLTRTALYADAGKARSIELAALKAEVEGLEKSVDHEHAMFMEACDQRDALNGDRDIINYALRTVQSERDAIKARLSEAVRTVEALGCERVMAGWSKCWTDAKEPCHVCAFLASVAVKP